MGGSIAVTGLTVDVKTATLDASGTTAGGKILVGGDLHGSGDLAHASATVIEADATLKADSSSGKAGQIVVWSDVVTSFQGAISAVGNALTAGSGGNAEVSSKGTLDLRSTNVALGGGQLLLDPDSITISDAASDFDGHGLATILTGNDRRPAERVAGNNAEHH